jgi:hypothetical protein
LTGGDVTDDAAGVLLWLVAVALGDSDAEAGEGCDGASDV